MNRIVECGRCGSKIVESPHKSERPFDFTRYPEQGSRELEQIKLCSMCLDDIWEFVFESEVDRSTKADPIPIEKLESGVERHIDDLEGVLESLEAVE